MAGNKPLITKWTALGLAAFAVLWFFDFFESGPSRQDAEKFIAWGFVSASDGIPVLDANGKVAYLKKAAFKAIREVDCHRNKEGRRFFQRRQRGFPRYDCLYRLDGTSGEAFWAAYSAIYMRGDTHDMTPVGDYSLMFWAPEPDQRRILALYGIIVPKPAS